MSWLNTFIYSVMLYSSLRYFDVLSTKLCLERLDPELHEVNPIVAPLIKKIGFNKTMLITWIPFAIIVGFADAFWFYPFFGIPGLWLLFGLFHLIAAANNVQLYYHTKIFGAEVIEENTWRIINILKSLSTFKKITFLIKTNILNLFFTVYGIFALFLLLNLVSLSEISFKAPVPVLLVVGPPIMVLDLIMFFPTMIFGSLIISIRRLKINREHVLTRESTDSVIVSVEFIETLLNEARKKGANHIQLSLLNKNKLEGSEKNGA